MDCYYHGYSGGPGGPCEACERENGPSAGYYKAKAELHKAQGAMKKRLEDEKRG
jgi:hypothetical protein